MFPHAADAALLNSADRVLHGLRVYTVSATVGSKPLPPDGGADTLWCWGPTPLQSCRNTRHVESVSVPRFDIFEASEVWTLSPCFMWTLAPCFMLRPLDGVPPFTLNPQPSTLNPQPSTLNPQCRMTPRQTTTARRPTCTPPARRAGKPSTLNPQPCLNPEPWTLINLIPEP